MKLFLKWFYSAVNMDSSLNKSLLSVHIVFQDYFSPRRYMEGNTRKDRQILVTTFANLDPISRVHTFRFFLKIDVNDVD